jgi:oxygen-dependent protoporphyrinogen oxidase
VALASVAVAVVRYDAAVAPRLPDATGVLVPTSAGLSVKAATLLSTKWPHLRRADGGVLVRASVGRAGGPDVLRDDDDTLAATVTADLARLFSIDDAPLAVHVERWPNAMPQYTRGHHARMAAMGAALTAHPRLAVAGAAYRGVGVPACIREAAAAADRVVDAIADTHRPDLAGSRTAT